jgi:hypothetical protein
VVPDVVEMQSEAGAAGAVHGSLQAGALTTTFIPEREVITPPPKTGGRSRSRRKKTGNLHRARS